MNDDKEYVGKHRSTKRSLKRWFTPYWGVHRKPQAEPEIRQPVVWYTTDYPVDKDHK
jgi:hypothetical protein